MKKIYIKFTFIAILFVALFSCSEDKLGPSIFGEEDEELDPTSYTYAFDKYLQEYYRIPYNLAFRYKMEDVGTDMDYNLVPSTYQNAQDMGVLVKYLWMDVYGEVVDLEFLKRNGPRIIHLIGSPAYNPVNGTMILGLAEGGLKVSLFRCNQLDFADIDDMNEFYFKTMHHEFAHILHQTKTYPNEFNLISSNHYEPFSWQDRDEKVVASLGFVTPYGSSQDREDFVEVIANYIVKPDYEWQELLSNASKGWVDSGKIDETTKKPVYVEGPDTDGVDGKAIIEQKLSICREWLKDAWGIDLDALRKEVQRRQYATDENGKFIIQNGKYISNFTYPIKSDPDVRLIDSLRSEIDQFIPNN